MKREEGRGDKWMRERVKWRRRGGFRFRDYLRTRTVQWRWGWEGERERRGRGLETCFSFNRINWSKMVT